MILIFVSPLSSRKTTAAATRPQAPLDSLLVFPSFAPSCYLFSFHNPICLSFSIYPISCYLRVSLINRCYNSVSSIHQILLFPSLPFHSCIIILYIRCNPLIHSFVSFPFTVHLLLSLLHLLVAVYHFNFPSFPFPSILLPLYCISSTFPFPSLPLPLFPFSPSFPPFPSLHFPCLPFLPFTSVTHSLTHLHFLFLCFSFTRCCHYTSFHHRLQIPPLHLQFPLPLLILPAYTHLPLALPSSLPPSLFPSFLPSFLPSIYNLSSITSLFPSIPHRRAKSKWGFWHQPGHKNFRRTT